MLSDFSMTYLALSNFSLVTLFLGAFTTFAPADVIAPDAKIYGTIHMVAGSIQTLLEVYMIYLISMLVAPLNSIEDGAGDSFLYVVEVVLVMIWFTETLPNFLSYYYLNGLSESYNKNASIKSKSSLA